MAKTKRRISNSLICNFGDGLLGSKIKDFRLEKKISQSDFAEGLCISIRELDNIENGHLMPDESTFILLHDVYKLKLSTLAAQ